MEPMWFLPETDKLLPNRAKALQLKVLPKCVASSTLIVEPKRAMLNKDSVDPNRINPRTENEEERLKLSFSENS
jgi:hypothetical protein